MTPGLLGIARIEIWIPVFPWRRDGVWTDPDKTVGIDQMARQQLTALVFDKDGTLFDFEATWGRFVGEFIDDLAGGDETVNARLAARLGYDPERETFRPDSIVIAGTAGEVAAAALEVLPERSLSELLDELNDGAAVAAQVPVVPLADFLTGLRGRGIALGVATNDAEAPARAHLADVLDRLDFVAGYDSGHGGKPAPGQLLAFAKAVGRRPDQCGMVGDSTHDLVAARAAGMTAIGVLTGIATRDDLAPYADVVLPSIAELGSWLDAQ